MSGVVVLQIIDERNVGRRRNNLVELSSQIRDVSSVRHLERTSRSMKLRISARKMVSLSLQFEKSSESVTDRIVMVTDLAGERKNVLEVPSGLLEVVVVRSGTTSVHLRNEI